MIIFLKVNICFENVFFAFYDTCHHLWYFCLQYTVQYVLFLGIKPQWWIVSSIVIIYFLKTQQMIRKLSSTAQVCRNGKIGKTPKILLSSFITYVLNNCQCSHCICSDEHAICFQRRGGRRTDLLKNASRQILPTPQLLVFEFKCVHLLFKIPWIVTTVPVWCFKLIHSNLTQFINLQILSFVLISGILFLPVVFCLRVGVFFQCVCVGIVYF